jgi:cell division transport system permease protein
MTQRIESTPIGLSKIWAEGQGVEHVSPVALLSHVVRRAFENLARSPVTATLTIVTIGIALFLLGMFVMLVQNSNSAVSGHGVEVLVNVFLKDSVSEERAVLFSKEIQERVASFTEVPAGSTKVTYRDKAQALKNFRAALGEDSDVLEGLDTDNPLPASLDISLDNPEAADILFSKLSDAYRADPRVEAVRYSRGAVRQLRRILRVVEFGGGVGVLFLLVITGFIIANTIKLALYAHRVEVEIMQLVGAKRSSIFAPYMLEGGVQGVLGALCGLIFVYAAYLFLRDVMSETDVLQFIFPQYKFLSFGTILAIVAAGAVVGMSGSFLAVRRFLTED